MLNKYHFQSNILLNYLLFELGLTERLEQASDLLVFFGVIITLSLIIELKLNSPLPREQMYSKGKP